MKLEISHVHRHLETSLKVMGIHAHDLLLVLILASMMNLIFGQSSLNLLMVFVFPISIGLLLVISKRNKPEYFLVHWLRYQIKPGFYSAAQNSHKRSRDGIVPKSL